MTYYLSEQTEKEDIDDYIFGEYEEKSPENQDSLSIR